MLRNALWFFLGVAFSFGWWFWHEVKVTADRLVKKYHERNAQ